MWFLFDMLFEDDDSEDDGGIDDDEPVAGEREPESAPEDPALVARVERAFKAERSRIRAGTDVKELRSMRADYERLIAEGRLPGVAGVRGNDLIELLDERITDLKATRLADKPS